MIGAKKFFKEKPYEKKYQSDAFGSFSIGNDTFVGSMWT